MNFPPLFQFMLVLVFGVSTGTVLAEDAVVFQEKFDAASDDGSVQTPGGYQSSDLGVTAARALKKDAGINNTGAIVLTAKFGSPDPASLAALLYQNGSVTGNASAKCSDYYLEFDAKGSKAAKDISVIIQDWRDDYFQGESAGSLSTTVTLPETADTFKTYRVALDDAKLEGKFDPSGKTWQIAFQIFGSNWGEGEGNTLVIDNIKVVRKGTN